MGTFSRKAKEITLWPVFVHTQLCWDGWDETLVVDLKGDSLFTSLQAVLPHSNQIRGQTSLYCKPQHWSG